MIEGVEVRTGMTGFFLTVDGVEYPVPHGSYWSACFWAEDEKHIAWIRECREDLRADV